MRTVQNKKLYTSIRKPKQVAKPRFSAGPVFGESSSGELPKKPSKTIFALKSNSPRKFPSYFRKGGPNAGFKRKRALNPLKKAAL